MGKQVLSHPLGWSVSCQSSLENSLTGTIKTYKVLYNSFGLKIFDDNEDDVLLNYSEQPENTVTVNHKETEGILLPS